MRVLMKLPEYERLRAYIFKRLESELDSRLYYHGIQHTRDYVLPAAQYLAAKEGIEGESLTLLLTGVILHDFGYIQQYENNESLTATLITTLLLDFSYTPEQIEIVKGIVMATALPQTAHNILEAIMCDADLYHLGENSFFALSHDLWRELVAFGYPLSEAQWHLKSIEFIENHTYFTATALAEQKQGKEYNIKKLHEQIANTPV
jgi:uncharacterized protein